MSNKTWNVYLSGEVHSDWRNEITKATAEAGLPVNFTTPVLDHAASDNCGDTILGEESEKYWKDHKAAKINAIRTRTHLTEADIVIVRFGEKYREWGAAFDAGFAAAIGIPLIVVHPEQFIHALKEVDAAALAVAQTAEQVVAILKHVTG